MPACLLLPIVMQVAGVIQATANLGSGCARADLTGGALQSKTDPPWGAAVAAAAGPTSGLNMDRSSIPAVSVGYYFCGPFRMTFGTDRQRTPSSSQATGRTALKVQCSASCRQAYQRVVGCASPPAARAACLPKPWVIICRYTPQLTHRVLQPQ